MVELAEEIIAVLCSDPNATVMVTVEIAAVSYRRVRADQTRRDRELEQPPSLKISDWD
jgi:hypothetical protein